MNLQSKRVFLSGPMTGIPHYNVDGFAVANAICKEHGARHVYNPAQQWLRESTEEGATKVHADYMRDCVHELTREDFGRQHLPFAPYYDLVVLLPGWAESDGSRIEYTVARACGIPTVDLCDVEDGE